jgi:hypothetical protein
VSAVAITGSSHMRTPGFRSPTGSRRWAWIAFVWVCGIGSFCITRGLRDQVEGSPEISIVVSLFTIVLGALGLGVRLARLSVDGDGVHWGWGGFGFSMSATRLGVARLHPNAVVLAQKRTGWIWCLSGRDWAPFKDVLKAFKKSGLPVEEHAEGAPIRARMQAYGLALDLILVVNVLLVTACWLM